MNKFSRLHVGAAYRMWARSMPSRTLRVLLYSCTARPCSTDSDGSRVTTMVHAVPLVRGDDGRLYWDPTPSSCAAKEANQKRLNKRFGIKFVMRHAKYATICHVHLR